MSAIQTDVFDQLSATFPADIIKKWDRMVIAWNDNPKAPNPYKEPKNSENVSFYVQVPSLTFNHSSETTLQDVRLQLTKEEGAKVALGMLPRHKVSLSAFLLAGFELEDSQ